MGNFDEHNRGISASGVIAVGVALSTRLAATLDAAWLRPAVLSFAGLAGAVAILNGVL